MLLSGEEEAVGRTEDGAKEAACSDRVDSDILLEVVLFSTERVISSKRVSVSMKSFLLANSVLLSSSRGLFTSICMCGDNSCVREASERACAVCGVSRRERSAQEHGVDEWLCRGCVWWCAWVSRDEHTVLGRSDTIDEGTAERGVWICSARLLKRGRITDTSSSGEMILSEGCAGECRGGGCVGAMMRSAGVSSTPTNECAAERAHDRVRRDVRGGRVGECVWVDEDEEAAEVSSVALVLSSVAVLKRWMVGGRESQRKDSSAHLMVCR